MQTWDVHSYYRSEGGCFTSLSQLCWRWNREMLESQGALMPALPSGSAVYSEAHRSLSLHYDNHIHHMSIPARVQSNISDVSAIVLLALFAESLDTVEKTSWTRPGFCSGSPTTFLYSNSHFICIELKINYATVPSKMIGASCQD